MTYRKELGFVAKDLHFGHLAKSFGLVDPPKQLVAERRDLVHWVKNGIHHGGHNLHKSDKQKNSLEQFNTVDPENFESKTKERVALETECSYLSNKEKDHSKGARSKLHFNEIDEVREQRMEKVKKERKALRQAAKVLEDQENLEEKVDEDGNPIVKKPEGKLIKIDDAATKRAKMQKQMNRARIVERSAASEFASSTGKGTKSVMAKRR